MVRQHIQVYTSFVTKSHIYIKGRLLANSIPKSRETDSHIRALWVSFRRALTREVKNAVVKLKYGKQEIDLMTDDEGYFEYLTAVDKVKSASWIQLIAVVGGKTQTLDVQLSKYLESVELGIISDIDDTIMITKVKSLFKLRMLINSVFINPFRRRPIASAAAFYRQELTSIEGKGPIVYISNSPWNMYDYVKAFLTYNGFPKGEIQLRDFGLHMLRKKKPLQFQNKYLEISKVLKVFQNTKFMLVGDSAESDFDIYSKINYEYPGRIDKIVIIKAGNIQNEERITETIGETQEPIFQLVKSFSDLLSQDK